MYYKVRQIVNIYIYKYVRTCFRKFRLLFSVLYQKQKYFISELKIDSYWLYANKN